MPAVLDEWNPWWIEQGVPAVLKGRERRILDTLLKWLNLPEVIILAGVRRAGKTTLMYQMIDDLLKRKIKPENILFVNLEDRALIDCTLEEIYSAYLQRNAPSGKIYVFLDEIQEKHGWERWVKKQYDLKKPIKFIISGSSSSLLAGEYATLLTGRNLTFIVNPLSFEEYLIFHNIALPSKNRFTSDQKDILIHQMTSYLEDGGFPEPNLRDRSQRRIILERYFNDILYRDVVFRHSVDAHKLTKLAVYMITNMGNLYTTRKLRRATGLSTDTIKAYMSYLDEAFMIRTISYFTYSSKPEVAEQRPSKSYCIDTGLRNSISYRFSKDEGRLAENVVAVELLKTNRFIFYWKGKNEVDFVIPDAQGNITAINVCYSDEIPGRELAGLKELKAIKKNRLKNMMIITRNTTGQVGKIQMIPLWEWLLKT